MFKRTAVAEPPGRGVDSQSVDYRSSATVPLHPSEAHVWFAWTDRFTDDSIVHACHCLLSEEELRRHKRYHFQRDRHLYLVSHAMVRHLLAGYLEREPKELEFVTNPYGRPEIKHERGDPIVRFNLSHTRDLAALVVTHTWPCGIDVETKRYRWNISSLADSVLSAEEMSSLQKLPQAEHAHHFLRYWTLKEAYVKARGMGLSLPLDKLSFEIGEKMGIRLRTHPESDSVDWQFAQRSLGTEHVMAVAVQHGGALPLSITYREFLPSAITFQDC